MIAVLERVPPAAAEVKAAHEGDGLVDDAEFLVLTSLMLLDRDSWESCRRHDAFIHCDRIHHYQRPSKQVSRLWLWYRSGGN